MDVVTVCSFDVPDGTWTVQLTVGSAHRPAETGVEVEARRTVITPVATRADQHRVLRATVDVRTRESMPTGEAASMIPSDRLAVCVVARSGTGHLYSVSFGDTQSAWPSAAEVSAETHVRYLDAPVKRVLSVMPTKYEDI